MRIDVWSDVVCPWCFVGMRRLNRALDSFEHAADVQVIYRAFELDPGAPPVKDDHAVELARKYGMSVNEVHRRHAQMAAYAKGENIDFNFDRVQSGNTFDAHRLLHFALLHGRQRELKEQMMTAVFTEGRPIGEQSTLIELGVGSGLDKVAVVELLQSDLYSDEVRADESQAARMGIDGVPFFLVDKVYRLSGAQDPDYLLEIIQQAWKEQA